MSLGNRSARKRASQIAGGVWLLATGVLQAADAVSLKVQTRLVRVPVTVTDRNGASLTNLEAADFRVFDGAEPQAIVSVSREEAPASVGIVLDLSGSMASKLRQATAAVREITAALDSGDEASLVTFADKPILVAGFTREPAILASRLAGVGAQGATALIDAVYMGLNAVRAIHGRRRAVVVISDGADNNSSYTERELRSLAIEADAQIYSISIAENNLSKDERQGAFLLEELSNVTGGLHFTVRHRGELPEAARKLARALKSLYVISYKPPAGLDSGKWRSIRVSLDAALRRTARVNARSGYYEP